MINSASNDPQNGEKWSDFDRQRHRENTRP